MLLPLVLLLQAAPPAPAQDAPAIVVTARPLKESERAWQECMARNCPPDEEITAALAHAENLFVAGDYLKARSTVQKTIGHVDRFAKQYPIPVGNIWRADARIAAHLGEAERSRSAQIESVDALKAGLAKGDSNILVQRIEIADTLAKQGSIDFARARYFKVVDEARRTKQPFVLGTALLRLAILDNAIADANPGPHDVRARESLDRILETTDPDLALFREAATLMRARKAAKGGDFTQVDAIAARYQAEPTKRPMLLYSPQFDFENTRFDRDASYSSLPGAYYKDQWVDLTFLIGPDGRVREAEVLRGSPTLMSWWTAPVLKAIAARRYAPLAVPAGLDGVRRVERFTVTGTVSVSTAVSKGASPGSPRIHTMDLTAEPAAE